MNFDIQQFLREIALSGAYQRSFDPPPNLLDVSEQAAIEIARLEQQRVELEKASQAAADAYAKASDAWEQAEAAWLPVAGELDTARTQYGDAKKKVDEALQAAKEAENQLQVKKSVADPVQQAATATQAATKVLPDDKELADAAQKFVARAQELAEEAAALSKTVDEKKAAVQPMNEALNNTKPVVEAARTKVTPLKQTLAAVEQAMRAERTKAAADAKALAAIDRRLATARVVAKLPVLHRTVATLQETVSARQAELSAAQKQLSDFAAVVLQLEGQGKDAGEKVTSVANALQTATEGRAKQTEAAQSISAALSAIERARQNLPDDAVLADAAGKLQTRASVAQSQSGELQKQIDALTVNHKAAQESFIAAQESLAAALAEKSRREQAVEAANQALAASQTECVAKQAEFDTLAAEANENWTRDFTVAALKPLTPEQLCWTVFRVTGVYDRYWQAEVTELDKAKPLSDEQRRDAAQLAARDVELEQRTYDKLKGNVGTFVAFYGAGAGQPQSDFFATADQALFAANGGAINSWVAPAGDNVTERVVKQNDLRLAAEELYLGVLTRYPSEEEAAGVVAYLSSRGSDKGVAAQELVWGLLNSAEFRFNH
jgi:DNA repair exonuclease SbcCD ATPase subunit